MNAHPKRYGWSVRCTLLLQWTFLVCSVVSCFSQASDPARASAVTPNTNDFSGLILEPPKTTRHQIAGSADYLIGEGKISLPLGFGFGSSVQKFELVPNVSVPDRSSDYFGATVSYSFGQAWYFDVSYAHGESSGTVGLADFLGFEPGVVAQTDGEFTVSDDWYQAYFRYAFPKLRGRKVSAYFRGGLTYVQSQLVLKDTFAVGGQLGQTYDQANDVTDLLGNVGFGMTYSIFSGRRMRVSLQLDGEAFGGIREQDMTERAFLNTPDQSTGSKSIDNLLYGGLVRLTARVEYGFGRTALFKAFADAGLQGRYTLVQYEEFTASGPGGKFLKGKTQDELLWGPYVRIGVSYSF